MPSHHPRTHDTPATALPETAGTSDSAVQDPLTHDPASGGPFSRLQTALRRETVAGILLVAAAALAIVWANSPFAESYFALRDLEVGYEPWHLRLSLGAWAADGLLAIFFFLVGLELKRESVSGDLRDLGKAAVPIAAAVGGVVVPALIYAAVNLASPETLGGWAIPTATDIAFAVAVLAIVGSHLPPALRLFLLTLAVVDDLLAITIIAVFYTEGVSVPPLLLALVPLAVFAVLTHRFPRFFAHRAWAAWVILVPLAVVTWALVHEAGIHATVAGVLLGFAVPVMAAKNSAEPVELAEHLEHRVRPLSAGFAVPVFAFFSAGVAVGGWGGLTTALAAPVTLGIVAGLVLGKPLGIMGATWLTTRLTGGRLDPSIRWIDLLGIALLAGIGFTVSLLISELSFDPAADAGDQAKVAILTASVLAAVLAGALLAWRNRRYRQAPLPVPGKDAVQA
ncbi:MULTISPECIES: Na+/H+ antiporter NhaA [Kocuria]|uniref:Na(+)/H(+) antiporter NhaA n=3 Tax=Kocuria TaxID=57493 RepID=A0A7D7L284_KOCVA|nr:MULTISPECIES: Na+/H+ antiporter NhaA [Kocuria]QMS55844.1 Na(+)/H(+) antiporter NhaA [Kocuria varians]RUP82253.1 Na+/H+ antiporter NhaA [Kocuria sp. HSID17590]RUQ11345.1 Na+/H+ antiporter NhaA [Kocuria sp. HSID17582]